MKEIITKLDFFLSSPAEAITTILFGMMINIFNVSFLNMYHEARDQGTTGETLTVSFVVLNRVNDEDFLTLCAKLFSK